MHILLDTNVVLDVLLARQKWLESSGAIWRKSDEGVLTAYLGATTFTDIFYIVRRSKDIEIARQSVEICLNAFTICEVNRGILEAAQAKSGSDFEDNILIACAGMYNLDGIVTRDKKGFKDATIPVYTPEELLQEITT